jgi:hypothetical protein
VGDGPATFFGVDLDGDRAVEPGDRSGLGPGKGRALFLSMAFLRKNALAVPAFGTTLFSPFRHLPKAARRAYYIRRSGLVKGAVYFKING